MSKRRVNIVIEKELFDLAKEESKTECCYVNSGSFSWFANLAILEKLHKKLKLRRGYGALRKYVKDELAKFEK